MSFQRTYWQTVSHIYLGRLGLLGFVVSVVTPRRIRDNIAHSSPIAGLPSASILRILALIELPLEVVAIGPLANHAI
jgi:hypothetical protein